MHQEWLFLVVRDVGGTLEMSERDHKNLGDNLLPSTVDFDKAVDDLKRIHQLEIFSLIAKIADLKQEIKKLKKVE